MANEKISSFDDLTTAGITLSQVEGVAAYYDNGGTLTNVKFSGNDIINTVGGLPGVLAVNDTATAGQEIKILDFAGFNPITYKATGIESSPLIPITITAKGNLTLEATSANTTMSLYNLASAGTGSILISNRQTNGELELDTDGELKITLPSAPSVGDVLSAKDVNGNVEWVTPSAGGSSAFTTLTAADVIDWDYATDGPNIKVTLGAGLENVLTVDTIGEFPDGSEGWVILDPSASVDYRLPDEDYGSAAGLKSVITSGDVSLEGTNPVLFHYTYDGTQFWWTKFVNMIEPANYPPSVNFDSGNLIFYHDPAVFNQATTGVVGPGDTVENMVSSALIGDLVTGSTVTSQIYYPKGNAEPFSAGAAFYSFGNTANRITRSVNIAVPISTEVTWSGYIQGPYNLASSFQTLFDFDGGTNYDQQLYIDNGEFNVYQKGTFSYPVLDDYTATGGADLSNAWLFVSIMNTPSTGPATNDGTVRIAVGCQASLDAAVAAGGATNWDYDGTGNTIAVDANGLYFESITNLDLDEFNFENFVLGNGRNGALNEGGVFHYGLFGIFNTVISDVVVAANWTSTRDTYGIT